MHLKHLSLVNFRSYVRLEIDLSPHITILQGDNAQGKTNFLEACFYLATASSPRADADRQLINWLADQDVVPFAKLTGQLCREGAALQIEIIIARDQSPGEPADTAALRKTIRINGVNKRVAELVGQIPMVLFLPQDIELVGGSPGERRHYLDLLLSQIDSRYYRALLKYDRVIYQRNHLLRYLRERGQDSEQLAFWDRQMIEGGSYLIARRRWLIHRLNELVAEIHLRLTGQQEHLRLSYESGVHLEELGSAGYQLAMPLDTGPTIQSESQEISRAFAAQLALIRREEIERGMSLLGPHRDDMRFLVNGVDLTVFGSRGQQRTVALAMKMAEVECLHQEMKEMPILLLDDVISELDPARCSYLLDTLQDAQQVIITTTDLERYPAAFLERAALLRVQQGRIESPSK